MFQLILLHFACNGRPWANQAHFSAQHVEKLRQFIETVPSQNAACPGNSWIVLHFEENSLAFILIRKRIFQALSIDHHRTKFEAAEDISLFPDSLGSIENRPR